MSIKCITCDGQRHDVPQPCVNSSQHHFCACQVVDLLLRKGAAAKKEDAGRSTPLHYAAQYLRVDVVHKLLECGTLPTPNTAGT